jgi:hypothetical protein
MYDGEIFFKVRATVVQRIYSNLSVNQQSTQKTPQKTNSNSTSIYNSIYANVKIIKNVQEVRFPMTYS